LTSRAVWPSVGLLLGAIISGLTWLPLRAIEDRGVAGLWIALVTLALACVPMLPGVIKCRGIGREGLIDLMWIGLLVGVAWTLYFASLTATEVARAILLFYLAPVWGTLLEVFVLRQPVTLRRLAALALGAAGLIAILGIGSIDFTFNLGDLFALLSGILWSIGLLVVYRRPPAPLAAQSAALGLGALAGGIAMVLLLEPAPAPGSAVLIGAGPWIALAAFAFVLPLWILSLWAARSVSPGRATLIFMAEVCVGIGSAALWADQPFGLRESIGTALVLAAAAVEFTGSQPAHLAPRSTG
jgi:drug/metabolite transporter (DMT)-like permease